MFRITQRLVLAGTLMLLGVLPSLLHPGQTDAAPYAPSDRPDQCWTALCDQTISTAAPYQFVSTTQPVAQIVTAGQYGFLDRISVVLDNVSASGPVDVSIRKVAGGVPSGTDIIGRGTIPLSALPSSGNPAWVTATISGSISLTMTPGTQYAIVLSSATGTVRWYRSADDAYARGYLVFSTPWVALPYDAMFQTSVIPDTQDQNVYLSGLYQRLGSTPVGQTFTVGTYGILDRVSVYLGNSSSTPADIAVSIRTVTSAGLPTTTQVSSGTIPASAIPTPGSRAWATGSVSPLLVTPGTRYALLLSTSVSGPGWQLGSDSYPGGSLVIRNSTSWAIDASDASFQTLVVPPLLDKQQTDTSYRLGISPDCIQDPYHSCNYWQPFTASWSGTLPLVSVALAKGYTPAPDTATVTITVAAYPAKTVLGTGTIPASALPPSMNPAWFDVPITGVTTSKVQVSPGTQYAIHVSVNSGWVDWFYTGDPLDPYGTKVFAYKTHVLPLASIATAPRPSPGPAITPCSNGVCPSASSDITPADLTNHVSSHVQFQERPDGSVHGVLNFSDPGSDGLTLHGCTTESAACRLTVAEFACSDTDPHAITVGGTLTLSGETQDYSYTLTFSGVSDGPGSFSLSTRGYAYSLTQDGIVDVTCPLVATR